MKQFPLLLEYVQQLMPDKVNLTEIVVLNNYYS